MTNTNPPKLTEDDFVGIIHGMLWHHDKFISTNDIYEKAYSLYKEQIDPDGKNFSGKNTTLCSSMNAEYGQICKNAKGKIKECLKNHDKNHPLDFETEPDKNDGRKHSIKYPADLDFNPYDEIYKKSKKFKLSELQRIINESEGLFPKSWLANFRLEISRQDNPEDQGKVIQFDNNKELKNIELVPLLYSCIKKKVAVSFRYCTFRKKEEKVTLYPKFLKQYNNRWFVFGATNRRANGFYPIDRIEGGIKELDIPYKDNGIDYSKQFDNIIGISYRNLPRYPVKLRISDEETKKDVIGYLSTKPLLKSQKIEDDIISFTPTVLNYEFETHILEFADRLEVLEPEKLREDLHERAEKIVKNTGKSKKN